MQFFMTMLAWLPRFAFHEASQAPNTFLGDFSRPPPPPRVVFNDASQAPKARFGRC